MRDNKLGPQTVKGHCSSCNTLFTDGDFVKTGPFEFVVKYSVCNKLVQEL